MNFALDAKSLEIQRQARELASSIEAVAIEADESNDIHPTVLSALQASGLSELMVPAEFGGRAEQLDPLAICLVREALMGTSSHLDSLFAMQGIGSYAITIGGSPEHRTAWLPRIATAAALRHAATMVAHLTPDVGRMRVNLDASDGAIMAEAAVFALADHVPRGEAQALVKAACAEAACTDGGCWFVVHVTGCYYDINGEYGPTVRVRLSVPLTSIQTPLSPHSMP